MKKLITLFVLFSTTSYAQTYSYSFQYSSIDIVELEKAMLAIEGIDGITIQIKEESKKGEIIFKVADPTLNPEEKNPTILSKVKLAIIHSNAQPISPTELQNN